MSNEPTTAWHALTDRASAEALETDLSAGLDPAVAGERLARVGRNTLPEAKGRTVLGMFLDQFKDFLVLILLAAAVVSALLPLVSGESEEGFTDALVIAAILVLNAVLGVAQEHKAGKALEALKRMSVPRCEVVRGGRQVEISSEELAPGDLVILREGDFVPGDLRLVEARSLRIDEASLTGESAPVEKAVEPLAEDVPLADRSNMVYAGTHVTYGRGRGLAVATGMQREIGRIAKLLEGGGETLTPLQRNLAGLGKLLGVLALAICGLVFVVGVWQGAHAGRPLGRTLFNMFMTAVSLAVAAIPEGLPAVVTIVLALGVYRMSRHQAIVRKLPAVETLGCATYICTDKTGTLTQNRMAVQKILTTGEVLGAAADPADLRLLIEIGALCNDSHVERAPEGERRLGDPTELALVDLAERQSIDVAGLRRRRQRLDEVPFDSQRKMMSTLHDFDGARRMLVKGAPDVLIARCSHFQAGGKLLPFGPAERQQAHGALEALASAALRVLALAWKDLPDRQGMSADDESELVFAGLAGMMDPPRPEVKAALEEARDAGIRTIMITGDNLLTAKAVAAELGLFQEGDRCYTGAELEKLSPQQLSDEIESIRVFARVWPEQKLKIVQALQEKNEVVAMTGDGVNDAPALKWSDIGVAMGVTGTDVAKETADVVLADDNFATIVHAIKEGRVIFENIRKFIVYLLACNLGEIFCIFVPILIGLQSPLFPVQILLINLVTDGLPALALGVDVADPDVMRRRPRNPREGIVSPYHLKIVLYNAAWITAAVTASYVIGRSLYGQAIGMTMAFVTLAADELWRAYSFRSETRCAWRINPLSNPYLLGALAISGGILVLSITVAPVAAIFKNEPLAGAHWLIALGLSLIPFTAYETLKFIRSVVAGRGRRRLQVAL